MARAHGLSQLMPNSILINDLYNDVNPPSAALHGPR